MDFSFIDEGDMEFTPRGRKSNVPKELVDAIRKMPKGKAIVLTAYTVKPNTDTAKTERARVGATIRSASAQAGVKVSIRWSSAGVPQIAKRS